jgi:hypothetical protein
MYWLQGPVGRAGEIRRKRHAGAGSFERGRGGDDPMWADEGMWTYHLDQFGDGLLMFTVYKMLSHWVYGIWFTTLLDSGIFCHGLIPKWFRYKVSAEHVHGNGQGLKKTWHGLSQKKSQPIIGRSAAMTCETASTWGCHVKLSRQAELGCSIWRTRALQAHCYFWPPENPEFGLVMKSQ